MYEFIVYSHAVKLSRTSEDSAERERESCVVDLCRDVDDLVPADSASFVTEQTVQQ